MMEYIFRQYDIRAKIGPELALDEVYGLALAIAAYFLHKNPQMKTVAVGADGRTHSPAILAEVCRALQDSGLNVLFIGVCPTPVLYFCLHTQAVDAGIMITASHNGKEYNGLKMCIGKSSVWGAAIQEILSFYKRGMQRLSHKKGSYAEQRLIPSYIAWLKNHFVDLIGLEASYLIDCGNGAAGTVLPQLIAAFGWKRVGLLFEEVDGNYPNHEADPTVPENMKFLKSEVAQRNISCGVGLDGDCDRMTPLTKSGELVAGDRLLALFAQDLLAQHPGAAIIFDIKCSALLPKLIKAWGGVPVMVPSGHSIIKHEMVQHNALLAGELSCHFFFKDDYFGYDDGIYAALRLMRMIKNSGKTLDELLAQIPVAYATRESRIAYDPADGQKILAAVQRFCSDRSDVQCLSIDGIRVTLPGGWFLLRSSNTQPVMCLRIEADSPHRLIELKHEVVTLLAPFFDTAYLIPELELGEAQ